MNSTKIVKITIAIIMGFLINLLLSPTLYAKTQEIENVNAEVVTKVTGDFMGGAKNFEQAASNVASNSVTGSTTIDDKNMQELSDMVYNTFFVLGVVIAVIVGLVIGIKFMLGSVEEKAEIKQTLPPYIIGCIIIFGAFAIWKIVVNILNQI